jgi:hypothetical protein
VPARLIHNLTPTGATLSPATSSRASQALLDYLHLGPARTIPALLQHYQTIPSAPTHSYATLRKWSFLHDWPARAIAFDAIENQSQQDEFRARREALLQQGLALEHERIERLTAWLRKLDALVVDDEALWIKNVKVLHLENNRVERVEMRRFNAALIRQLRGLLEDIAAETGGRPARNLLSRAGRAQGGPEKSTYELGDFSLDVLTPEERAEFIRLQNKIFSTFG